jgi:beta-glucosidase
MEGRTYRYFKGEPLWEFGYGLSYTSFAYKNLQVPVSENAGNEVKVAVDVTNTGKMDGEEVVEFYITDKEASAPVPLRSLAGFKKVFLKAGETKKVDIILMPERFSLIDNAYNRVIEPGKFLISVGGKQPGVIIPTDGSLVQAEIDLTGRTFSIKD